MKKILIALAFGIASLAAHAEASFDQIQTLIEQKNYAAAEKGLEVIIQNHPKSAKAFYAMAQAQAGLGNLEKARHALDIATGLNPTLDFAPQSSVRNLKEAITPQIGLIEPVEESHTLRNFILFLLVAGAGVGGYFWYSVYKRKEAEEEAELSKKLAAQAERDAVARAERAARDRAAVEQAEKEIAEHNAKQDALKAHKNYGKPGFDPANPDKLKTKAQLKKEADEVARLETERQLRVERLRAEAAEDEARRARMHYSSTPTVVNNSSGTDLLTGVMIGSMMNNHHHDTERTVIRETVREVPAKDSSWDDTPSRSSSRSSSWDDDSSSSSKKSSSWDDDSSSKSSSSWSSSSSSDSSSSWSSSDSSSSSSSSSSSWD